MADWGFDALHDDEEDYYNWPHDDYSAILPGPPARYDDFWTHTGATASHAPPGVAPTSTSNAPPHRASAHQPPPLPRVTQGSASQNPSSFRQPRYAHVSRTANEPLRPRSQSPNHQPEDIFDYDPFDDLDEAIAQANTSNSDNTFQEFVTLEDSDIDDEEDMPPATRQRGATGSRRQSIVDLTVGSTPPASTRPPALRGRKRSADSTDAGEGRATKRKRSLPSDIEEIDMANDAPSAEEQLLKAQQQEAIKAQQAAQESAKPVRIGKRQCMICMENYTNCTVTACGHFYCHECLIQALMAGARNSDRGTGTCSVCRKPLSHTAKKKTDIIPISFMTKAQYDKQRKGIGAIF